MAAYIRYMMEALLRGLLRRTWPLANPPHQKPRVLSSGNETAVRLLYEYPLGTFFEAIAVRPNGELLLTLPYNSSVHNNDPLHSNYTPTVVHNFDGLTIFGITEYDHGVYAVNGGGFSSSTGPVAGTCRVDSLNLTQTTATSFTIANISSGQFLNGMTSLPRWGVGPSNVLVNDVAAGVVYNLDPISGKYFIAINNTYTQDDFALRDTIAYVTTGSGNSIERVVAPAVDSRGLITTEIVAGSLNSTSVAGPTAAVSGCTSWDSHILYITTSGTPNVPVDKRIRISAQVLAIDTKLCSWA
ncbi:putative six-bladed beta-propeller -like protein [Botrytis fragariae]|uniref:Putative six-bladed beta-propeller -like protein n=1 Tax=Botrytis fragariae TaxID=1964551 RepID=A0A8H6ASL5_9HELO|nr:putative six-bladed beta-propeller -like protein [Botrytis fragariae]KAF5872841.1 putative six-bladed beta-propeller -like protein [Botrytis fragariae]